MAIRAYVLIEATTRRLTPVAEALRRVPEVLSIDIVTGPYDMVAILEVEDVKEIEHVMGRSIHSISGVMRTATCLATPVGTEKEAVAGQARR